MTFRLNIANPGLSSNPLSDALDDWREAEELVVANWALYKAAPPDMATDAYSAYRAALDAEEMAASELQQLSLDQAD